MSKETQPRSCDCYLLEGACMIGKIDQNIKNIVNATNRYPGVETTGSCGGHRHPQITSQKPENEFYVQIDICDENGVPTKEGWNSLGKLSQAIMNYSIATFGAGEIVIEFCNLAEQDDDENGSCNYIEMHGKDVDRNVLFDAITICLES
jgi:hypothetical protein